MHAGVCNEHVEGNSDERAEVNQPLMRELELDEVAAQVPDLLEPSPEHQPTIEEPTPGTPSQQHAAPGATGEAERVHII